MKIKTYHFFRNITFVFLLLIIVCTTVKADVITGAEQTEAYLPLIKGKRVGLVANQTSIIGLQKTHLLDSLLKQNVNVIAVFAPEHGFRGDADAGEVIKNGKDKKTGVSIISLYGDNKKPTAKQLSNIDVLIFDIQDVGARFYTYISTLHYVMEACAENRKQLIILDRPNPCDYVDGPVLKPEFKSFVGMHAIPLLHGCTVGELAKMINGQGWLSGKRNSCELSIIPVRNWKHGQSYSLPVKPSPNLPNDQSIRLYPSLCAFESTRISVGRGTTFPFQVLGAPDRRYGTFTFTPKSLPGFDKNPMHKDNTCYGIDLREEKDIQGFSLKYVIDFYKKSRMGASFFTRARWMDQLMGTDSVRKAIIQGKTEDQIRATWDDDLDKYQQIRRRYLLY